MKRPDVLVVGGGVVGLVAALRLAEEGARVAVVDAEQNAGSTANAGSLHVQMQSRFLRLFPDLAPNVERSLPFYKLAVQEWERLDAEHGPFDLVHKGGLMLAESADQMAFLEGKAAREADKGLSVEMLDRPALERIAPWLGPQIVGGELCHDEGKLNPLIANRRLRAAGLARGVTFVRDRVRKLEPGASGMTAICQGTRLTADRVVIAAAWGAGALVEGLGVHIPTRAEPLHMNITEAGAPNINHLVQHAERSITLKQFRTGQIVIGGGWPARDRGDAQVPQVLVASLLGNVALAGRLAPGITGLRIIRTWAGRNTTVDGASVLGPLRRCDRVVMAVPGDAGYTLAPLVARIAARLTMGQAVDQDIAALSPQQFAA